MIKPNDDMAAAWGDWHTPEAIDKHNQMVAAKREEAAARLAEQARQAQARTEQRAREEQEHNTFMQAVQARREAVARGERVDPATLPRLSGVLQEKTAEARAQHKQHVAEQAASPYAQPGWRLPPGSKFAPSKESLVNRE